MESLQFKVFMSPNAGERVSSTLSSGFIGEGPRVKEFEKALGNYLGVKNVVALNSCTSALHIALKMCGGFFLYSKPKVLTTPLTCFATTAAILQANMEPVWCDIDPDTCNICLKSLKKTIELNSVDTVLVVHYAGYPVDMRKLDEIMNYHDELYGFRPNVIEDCAHAFGATAPWGKVGNGYFGNYCCFSFQAIKTLTTGDGGALISPKPERAKKLRWFGLDREKDRKSQDIQESGFKYQMNDIAASIGLANLPHIDGLVARQQDNIRWYAKTLPDIAPRYLAGFNSSGWMYPVIVGDAARFDKAMKSRGISTGLTHERNDKYDCVREYSVELPGVAVAENTVSCIPSGWWVTDEEREYIIASIKKGW